MSEDNVEILHQVIAAWNRKETEAVLALLDPEMEYVNAPDAIEPGTRRGHDELVAVLRAQWETLPTARWELNRLHPRGDEVISEQQLSMTMPGSEAEVATRALVSWRFRDGSIIRLEVLGAGPSFQTALEAAGLSE